MKLTLQSAADGGIVSIEPFPFEVGRDSSNELWIANDPDVSMLHARFTRDNEGVCRIHDLESNNGTFVNEAQVEVGSPVVLKQGDELRFGKSKFTVGFQEAPTERPLESAPVPAVGAKTEAFTPTATAPTAAGTPGIAAASEGPGSTASPSRPRSGSASTSGGSGGSHTLRNVLLGGVAAIVLVLIGVAIAGGGDDGPRPTSEVIAEAKPSTVLVVAEQNGQRVGNGSGWVYDAERGLVVTNAHVVDGGEEFQVSVEGDPGLRDATVQGVAPCDDLAVLKVEDTEGMRTMPLGSQEDLEQGDRLLAIGYPGNGTTEDEIQVTDGVVSVVRTRADEDALNDPDFAVYPNVVQTDAAINGGNSGGPAINENGKLIGVNTLASLQTQNQNFAIGVDRVKEVVPTLAEGKSLGWAGFGFRAISAEEIADAGLNNLEGGGALLVTSVVDGTGAKEQTILVDDLVTTVNNKFVENRRQYCGAVRGVKSGDKVPVQVLDSSNNYVDFYDLKVPFE